MTPTELDTLIADLEVKLTVQKLIEERNEARTRLAKAKGDKNE